MHWCLRQVFDLEKDGALDAFKLELSNLEKITDPMHRHATLPSLRKWSQPDANPTLRFAAIVTAPVTKPLIRSNRSIYVYIYITICLYPYMGDIRCITLIHLAVLVQCANTFLLGKRLLQRIYALHGAAVIAAIGQGLVFSTH